MAAPVELLARLAQACDRLYVWTHYFDRALVSRRPEVAARFRASESCTEQGFAHTVYSHWYQAARFRPGFCGSGETHPRWLGRDQILAALRHFGHDRIEVGLEEPDHPHGPAFALVSCRSADAGR